MNNKDHLVGQLTKTTQSLDKWQRSQWSINRPEKAAADKNRNGKRTTLLLTDQSPLQLKYARARKKNKAGAMLTM